MKQIIDDYSPILEGVTVEELKDKVQSTPGKPEMVLIKKTEASN
jgi:hypothetical protein